MQFTIIAASLALAAGANAAPTQPANLNPAQFRIYSPTECQGPSMGYHKVEEAEKDVCNPFNGVEEPERVASVKLEQIASTSCKLTIFTDENCTPERGTEVGLHECQNLLQGLPYKSWTFTCDGY